MARCLIETVVSGGCACLAEEFCDELWPVSGQPFEFASIFKVGDSPEKVGCPLLRWVVEVCAGSESPTDDQAKLYCVWNERG